MNKNNLLEKRFNGAPSYQQSSLLDEIEDIGE